MLAGLSLSYLLVAADLTLVSLSSVEYFFPCHVEFWARNSGSRERQPFPGAGHLRKQLIEYFCMDVSDAVGKLPVKAY